jgi:excisionase family DNA binding protein
VRIGDIELHEEDLATHIRIMGGSGMGKTTLVYSLLTQLVMEGEGFALLDPHEELYKKLLTFLAYTEYRTQDVHIIDATLRDLTATIDPFNSSPEPDAIETKAQILTDLTLQVWGRDSEAVRAEKVLYVVYVALLEQKRPLADLLSVIANPGVIRDPFARSEWEQLKGKANIDSVTTRVKPLTHTRLQAFTNPSQAINFPSLLDGRILLANLSRSDIMGLKECNTLSAFLVAEIWAAAFARRKRHPAFYLVIDEFKMLASEELASVLAQAQKFGLHLIFLHQTERQLPNYMRDAIGNVSCFVNFLRKGEVEIHGWGSGTNRTYIEPEPEVFDSPALDEAVARLRRAVTIAPSYAPTPEPPKTLDIPREEPETPTEIPPFRIGRGGEFHRKIQREIMKVAEGFGFKAEQEFPLDNGTAIDLVLSRDSLSIACEVSVTTSSDWEAGNVSHCLEAGYENVWVVVSDPQKVKSFTAKILPSLPVTDQAKVRVLSLDRCFVELKGLTDTRFPALKVSKKLAGRFMSVDEVAEFFGVSDTTIYRWKDEGRLPFVRVGRKILFERDVIYMIGRQDLTGKKRASVHLNRPIKIEKPKPKSKIKQDDRYRKMMKMD